MPCTQCLSARHVRPEQMTQQSPPVLNFLHNRQTTIYLTVVRPALPKAINSKSAPGCKYIFRALDKLSPKWECSDT